MKLLCLLFVIKKIIFNLRLNPGSAIKTCYHPSLEILIQFNDILYI